MPDNLLATNKQPGNQLIRIRNGQATRHKDANPLQSNEDERANMSYRTRFAAVAVFLACPALVFGQNAPADDQKASFAMSISLKDSTVKPGSDVQVGIELTNTSTEPISLWRSRSGPPPYTIRVLDRQARSAGLTAKGKAFQKGEAVIRENGRIVRAFPGSGSQVSIAPGETAKDSVFIDDQFDLTQPGTYTIQLERVDPASRVLVKSNVVTLMVAN